MLGLAVLRDVNVSTEDNKDTKGKIFLHQWIQGEIYASHSKDDALPEFFHKEKSGPRKLRCFRSGWAVFPPPAVKFPLKPRVNQQTLKRKKRTNYFHSWNYQVKKGSHLKKSLSCYIAKRGLIFKKCVNWEGNFITSISIRAVPNCHGWEGSSHPCR